MLRQRVITALILAGALIATLLFAPYPLQAILFALVAAAGGWEWAALVGAQRALFRAQRGGAIADARSTFVPLAVLTDGEVAGWDGRLNVLEEQALKAGKLASGHDHVRKASTYQTENCEEEAQAEK